MALLTTAELDAMRDALDQTMPDTGHILSVSRASDGEGGIVETWGTTTANVPCRLDSLTSRGGVGFIGSEQMQSAALKAYTTWILTLPYDVSLTTANRFQIGSTVFNVVEADAPKSWAVSRRATVEKV